MNEYINCPKCGTETHVVLVKKATKIATALGGAAGTKVSGYSGCNTGIMMGAAFGSAVPVVGTGSWLGRWLGLAGAWQDSLLVQLLGTVVIM